MGLAATSLSDQTWAIDMRPVGCTAHVHVVWFDPQLLATCVPHLQVKLLESVVAVREQHLERLMRGRQEQPPSTGPLPALPGSQGTRARTPSAPSVAHSQGQLPPATAAASTAAAVAAVAACEARPAPGQGLLQQQGPRELQGMEAAAQGGWNLSEPPAPDAPLCIKWVLNSVRTSQNTRHSKHAGKSGACGKCGLCAPGLKQATRQ